MDYGKLNRRSIDAHFPAKPALLVVDMQNYFVHPEGGAYLPDSRGALGNVRGLVSHFRERGLPVVFTRHAHESLESAGLMGRWWNEVIIDGTWDSELFAEMPVERDDVVLRKETYSAFKDTGLAPFLRVEGCDGVVVCGVMTHLCVDTTVRGAFMSGLAAVVAGDACASDTLEHHMGALRNLAHGFALVMNAEDIMERCR